MIVRKGKCVTSVTSEVVLRAKEMRERYWERTDPIRIERRRTKMLNRRRGDMTDVDYPSSSGWATLPLTV